MFGKAKSAVSDAQDAKGTADAAKGDAKKVYDESCGIFRDIAGLVTKPVAGPFVFTILWLLSVAAVVGYFFWLVSASATSWSEPMTELKQEAVLELEYPDIYMCLPAQYVKMYTAKDVTTQKYLIAAGVDKDTYEKVKGADYSECGAQRTGAFLKVDPLSKEIAKIADHGCPVKEITAAKVVCPADGCPADGTHVQIGCREVHVAAARRLDEAGADPAADEDDAAAPAAAATANPCKLDVNAPTDETMQWADGLANLLPKAADNKTKPLCLRYEMKEKASQLFSEQGKYMLFTRHALTGTPESVFMTAHLMPRGKKPYNEDVITATQIYFPGPPNLAVAMLGIEKVTDNTQVNSNAAANSVLSRITGASGETKTNYKYHMWTKTESEKVMVDGPQLKYADEGTVRVSSLLHAGIGFVFDDFVVRHITIRYKTFPEVFSEIGGLWAGCGALLWLVWSNSGHLRKKKNGDAGSEMIIFKYIPFPKWRTAWLKGGVPKDTVPV